ncbi:VOC family protein [Chitinophaga sp. HK235]|uniref:VOC family protein n=1 Tax=Chitinophaga sp. HK235 TaxID=2952571 RepID=UPI001BA91F01|nr:VOC family protein [Chitinophaga sp. HK235]
MKNAVNWFEIYTSNFERAKKFYTAVLQCELTDIPVDNERHSQMKYAAFPGDQMNGGAGGALVKLDVAKPGIGGTLVYFHSEDINTELSRVEAAGGKIIRPKQEIGDFGFIALIEDTEGNMVGLRSGK